MSKSMICGTPERHLLDSLPWKAADIERQWRSFRDKPIPPEYSRYRTIAVFLELCEQGTPSCYMRVLRDDESVAAIVWMTHALPTWMSAWRPEAVLLNPTGARINRNALRKYLSACLTRDEMGGVFWTGDDPVEDKNLIKLTLVLDGLAGDEEDE